MSPEKIRALLESKRPLLRKVVGGLSHDAIVGLDKDPSGKRKKHP